MRMSSVAISLCFIVLAIGSAGAQSSKSRDVRSANYWQPLCQSNHALCTGFIGGVLDFHDTMILRGNEPAWCQPDRVTYGQAQKIVVAYVEKNPAMLHWPYATLAAVALSEAFPCKQKPK